MTTAMAVMPHTDVQRALEMALSLDVPFWPQLPNYSYYEDMYVQASEHFPGILLDVDKRTLRFSMEKFISELEESLAHYDDPNYVETLQLSAIASQFKSYPVTKEELVASYHPEEWTFIFHDGPFLSQTE